MKRAYVVKINLSEVRYVYGFNAQHQCVVMTASVCDAKQFSTPRAAASWLSRYCDAGYGLRQSDCDVIGLAPADNE